MTRRFYVRDAAGTSWERRGSTTVITEPQPVEAGFTFYGPRAGGYLTGLSMGDNGAQYQRADVGGAYYKPPGTTAGWRQVFTVAGVPAARFDDFFCDAIACDPTQPDHAYAVVGFDYRPEGRVLRTTNAGVSWTDPGSKRFQVHGNGEWRYGREPLAVQPGTSTVVYYGSRREGLWRSTDGAATWTQLTALPAAPTSSDYHRLDVTIILIERNSALVGGLRQGLWAAVKGRGIYRSTNAGAAWSLMHPIAANAWVRDAMLDASGRLVACVFDPSGADSVVRITTTGAVSTISPSNGNSFSTVACHPTDPNRLVIGNDGLRVPSNTPSMWRTMTGGAPWTTVDMKISNGVDGDIWPTQSDLLGYMSTGQIKFDPSDPGRLWFAEGMGAWHGLDGAFVDWIFASRGIQELVAQGCYKPPTTGLVAATWDRGWWKWDDQGRAYLPPTAQAGVFCSAWDVQARPDAPLTVVMTVDDHQSGGTNTAKRLSGISFDGGATKTRFAGLTNGTLPLGLRFGTIAIARGSNDRMVWAPSPEDTPTDLPAGMPLRYTTDGWATALTPTITPALPAGFKIADYKTVKGQRKLVADPNVNDRFWALAWQGSQTWLLRSDDGGANWVSTNTGTSDNSGQYGAALTAVKVGTATHLYWSTGPRGDGLPAAQSTGQLPLRKAIVQSNGSATWTVVSGITGVHAGLGVGARINPSSNPTLFAYGWKGTVRGVYYSTDLGVTWTLMTNEPLGWHQGISAICGDSEVPGRVYVGMPGGSFFVGQV